MVTKPIWYYFCTSVEPKNCFLEDISPFCGVTVEPILIFHTVGVHLVKTEVIVGV